MEIRLFAVSPEIRKRRALSSWITSWGAGRQIGPSLGGGGEGNLPANGKKANRYLRIMLSQYPDVLQFLSNGNCSHPRRRTLITWWRLGAHLECVTQVSPYSTRATDENPPSVSSIAIAREWTDEWVITRSSRLNTFSPIHPNSRRNLL